MDRKAVRTAALERMGFSPRGGRNTATWLHCHRVSRLTDAAQGAKSHLGFSSAVTSPPHRPPAFPSASTVTRKADADCTDTEEKTITRNSALTFPRTVGDDHVARRSEDPPSLPADGNRRLGKREGKTPVVDLEPSLTFAQTPAAVRAGAEKKRKPQSPTAGERRISRRVNGRCEGAGC
ncbi:hypothetical protein GN956_G18028 [Arapaima gigas]